MAAHVWVCQDTGCTTRLRAASPDLLARLRALHTAHRHGRTPATKTSGR